MVCGRRNFQKAWRKAGREGEGELEEEAAEEEEGRGGRAAPSAAAVATCRRGARGAVVGARWCWERSCFTAIGRKWRRRRKEEGRGGRVQ